MVAGARAQGPQGLIGVCNQRQSSTRSRGRPPALLAATMRDSTETTFYVLAVYFGAVGIKRVRHAVPCALLAELAGVLAGVLAAIGVCYWFFG